MMQKEEDVKLEKLAEEKMENANKAQKEKDE